jgi:hypothetical protein
MGYHTQFRGKFNVSPPLEPQHREYLRAFAETRRMRRNTEQCALLPDPLREATGLWVGVDGGYFVGGGGYMGQAETPDIISYNHPPHGQPGLWCHWAPSEDGTAIEWDGGEKFYDYVDWIKYLLKHFLDPWGYELNGKVKWRGEEFDDTGTITITDNRVQLT